MHTLGAFHWLWPTVSGKKSIAGRQDRRGRIAKNIRGAEPNRFAAAVDRGMLRPYIDALFLSFPRRREFAAAHFPSAGKSDHRPPRVIRRTDHVHGHGLRGGGESANSFGSGYARGWRVVCHLPVSHTGHAGHGAVGQLSNRSRAWNVVERIFHIFRGHWAWRALANGARHRISFRDFISVADPDESSRAHRQRYSGLPEARNRRRHRTFHCIYRPAQRQADRRQSSDAGRFGKKSCSRLQDYC